MISIGYKSTMRVIISFLILISVKIFSKIFYKLEKKWISKVQGFNKIRIIILLHHTSLYEPLFVSAAPTWFIWRLARKMIAPGADKTLKRPIVGPFWKFMFPGLISITRQRDKSWKEFLLAIENRSVIVIAPEGRMKREGGLDSTGKPMSIRSGIADIIAELHEGRMMIIYSGGLHHVQHPGELIPRLFKTIKANIEVLEISDYKASLPSSEGVQFKKDVVSDLEHRMAKNCP